MEISLLSNSPEETLAWGQALGGCLRGDELVLLSGTLGAGKTLFTKGIALGLEIPAEEVVSPTFIIMQVLEGRCLLYHFDLYRLGPVISPESAGVDEFLETGVVVVEWADYLGADSLLSWEKSIRVELIVKNDFSRSLKICSELPYIDASEMKKTVIAAR